MVNNASGIPASRIHARAEGNPCRDLAPGQPRADSHGIWRPSPATKPAFSGGRGSCASPCPLASDKSPGLQRRAKQQRRHSIPIARHHLSGGLAQRDLLTTGRGATPSRAAAWARRARQSKDSLHYGELFIMAATSRPNARSFAVSRERNEPIGSSRRSPSLRFDPDQSAIGSGRLSNRESPGIVRQRRCTATF